MLIFLARSTSWLDILRLAINLNINHLAPQRTMAPSATNGDGMSSLEEIKAPAGVVLPPKEIKGKSSNLILLKNLPLTTTQLS